MSGLFGRNVLIAAADDAYAGPASLALITAARATHPAPRCCLLVDGFRDETRERVLASFAGAGLDVSLVDLSAALFEGLPVSAGHLTRTTYARLFIGHGVEESAERALWVDADTLTVAPIDELWATDLAGFPIAAVPDVAVPLVSSPSGVRGWRRLGLPPGLAYFNAGVLLVDLRAWADERIAERVVELVADAPDEAVFADQSPLNAVVAGRWLPLDHRWNRRPRNVYTLGVAGWDISRGGVRRAPSGAILHWAGQLKPWSAAHGPSPDRRRYLDAWARWLPDFEPPRAEGYGRALRRRVRARV